MICMQLLVCRAVVEISVVNLRLHILNNFLVIVDKVALDESDIVHRLTQNTRQIYYTTRVRAQIINHVNSSFDSYLVNGQMARNKVRVKGLEILRAASLLSTDIFVYTQFWDT